MSAEGEGAEHGEPGAGSGAESPKPPTTPSSFRPGARYSALVGLVFIGLIAVAAINAAGTDEGVLLGSQEVRGEPLPEFAVPDIRGSLDLDANIAQDDCETSRNPCPAKDRRTPACEIEPDGAIRVCDLFDRPLVISFWFTSPRGCVDSQDAVYELAQEYRSRANFLSVAIRGAREEVKRIAQEHGWKVPVGWDRDGAVSNVYRVGVCPTVGIARPGGIYDSVLIGLDATPEAVAERLDALISQRQRGPAALPSP